ncbi:SAM-dependent methyltransferase (plasmid) [Streptomyces seoulensis]|uniref:SAM-dependent methyltransferase n=1 Tax=Streptomyces seoulensis TaxID=73044 RepID=A0A4P6U569_STRSO|nr:methyltransferase [Streptomyces seoulensis]QBJ94462.1 SAM-dependent methyltransferase [Streptomyces seoulensis]
MKIPPALLATLKDRAHTDGNRLTLTGPRLDPRTYQQINEILEAVGGRWTSSEGAHLFPTDADTALAPVYATGSVVTLREKRQSAQYFPTPKPVVQRLIDLAKLTPGVRVLEPSAGSGAIAGAVTEAGATVDCIERDPGYAAVLADAGHQVHAADFLTVPAEAAYDRVVMNPPFTKGADMQHVEHALRFLKPDGLLVSVMSWTVTTESRATAKFRTLVEARGGTVEAVGKGAFRESGTDVPTVIVTIPATRPADAQPTTWPTRKTPPATESEFEDPAAIAAEIIASLKEATAQFEKVAAALERPAPPTPARPVDVVPLPQRTQDQLFFDFDGAA